MSEKTKSRFNEPVYSSTYSNGGWSERDALPTKDPIGDIDLDTKPWDKLNISHEQYKKDIEKYINTMKERLLVPKGKKLDIGFEITFKDHCCSKPDKYKNIISNNLKFWSCRNCGADLGDC